MQKLKEISSYMLNKFRDAVEKGIIIYDSDITRWAFKAQQGFTALNSWVRKFKITIILFLEKSQNLLQKRLYNQKIIWKKKAIDSSKMLNIILCVIELKIYIILTKAVFN